MKKDTIYIDTEDDITSIIEKVKASDEKIIALVPPKRVGVLQSAVNLKLLQKSASTVNKRIVLITSDKPLSALAAGVSIPVAKDLQSRPEVAEVAGFDQDSDEEDIINGEDLPVGELEKTNPVGTTLGPGDEIELPEDLSNNPTKSKLSASKKIKKTGPKIPNFDVFRKKLFLIIGGVILLLLFLIWAIWFAPHATVNIKAKTATESINLPVSLDLNGTTNPKTKVIRPIVQQTKKTNSTDFNTTGKKDIGEKASGTVTIFNRESSDSISIPAGTALSSNGLNFITASNVIIPGATLVGGNLIAGTESVAANAQEFGENYNISSGNDFTVAGQSPLVSGKNSSPFSGGSKRTVSVVSSSDIETAKAKILQQYGEDAKTELTNKFDENEYVIIDKSYKVVASSTTSSPASGAEASRAKVTVEMTYSLLAMTNDDVNDILNSYLKEKISTEKNQKIYDNGIKNLKLNDYNESSITLKTTGYIGPDINTKKLKPQLVGKNYEDIRQKIKSIEGVDDVNTNFFPFWVSTAPNVDKIDIKFSVQKR